MYTFDEIVGNALTSHEEVQMEYNAKAAAFKLKLAVNMARLDTSLQYPEPWLNGHFGTEGL
jgi:hypothetical protein